MLMVSIVELFDFGIGFLCLSNLGSNYNSKNRTSFSLNSI